MFVALHHNQRFQFTPLREGRQQPGDALAALFKDFNSRPYARGDDVFAAQLAPWKNFNSRPYARGDLAKLAENEEDVAFQFTPLREGRLSERL